MKKKPAKPQKPLPAGLRAGGPPPPPPGGPAPAGFTGGGPPPRPPAPAQGAVPGHGAPGPLPGGGAPAKPAARKPAARKKPVRRKLARPGENCVLDACYAVAGYWLDLDGEDGLLIPDALEALAALGLITGFAPADLEEVMPYGPLAASICETRAGLILGVDLPGPHAVVTKIGRASCRERV